jgi:predicted transcriptional regulator
MNSRKMVDEIKALLDELAEDDSRTQVAILLAAAAEISVEQEVGCDAAVATLEFYFQQLLEETE